MCKKERERSLRKNYGTTLVTYLVKNNGTTLVIYLVKRSQTIKQILKNICKGVQPSQPVMQ